MSHVSQIFIFIYIGEMLLKILAMDPYNYFKVSLPIMPRCQLLPR